MLSPVFRNLVLVAVSLLLFTNVALAASPLKWRSSLVFKNPGQALTATKYSNVSVVKDMGYNVMIKADGRPPHTAITWDSFDSNIFPQGSDGRKWVEDLAKVIDQNIDEIHAQGMKAMYWFDMLVLPKTLVDKYKSQIVDSDGKWSIETPMMQNITNYMLDAVFERFPTLDGLLIRTGEIYTFDVPYHAGATAITNGAQSHIDLLKMLTNKVISQHKKLLWYRTWAFDGFTTDPNYYLQVTNSFTPNDNLAFVIKHTAGDFWRTEAFNPTLGIGKHTYLVEVECQREYEAKGATPNYITNGLINGFEEYAGASGKIGLQQLATDSKFGGIVSWARGGGWGGPYPADEFWIDLNAQVLLDWTQNVGVPEANVFNDYATKKLGLDANSTSALRQVALLSARGVLYGHYSRVHKLKRLEWTRDDNTNGWFDSNGLKQDGPDIINAGQVAAVLREKTDATNYWRQVEYYAGQVNVADPKLKDFITHSATYGRLLYDIIAQAWIVMFTGEAGYFKGSYTDQDKQTVRQALAAYDQAWTDYNNLAKLNGTGVISTLYRNGTMAASVDVWRNL